MWPQKDYAFNESAPLKQKDFEKVAYVDTIDLLENFSCELMKTATCKLQPSYESRPC